MAPQKINFVILKDGKAVGTVKAFNSGVAIIKWVLENESGNIQIIMDPEYMCRFATEINDFILYDFQEFYVEHNPKDTIKN